MVGVLQNTGSFIELEQDGMGWVIAEAQKPGWQGGIATRKVFARNP